MSEETERDLEAVRLWSQHEADLSSLKVYAYADELQIMLTQHMSEGAALVILWTPDEYGAFYAAEQAPCAKTMAYRMGVTLTHAKAQGLAEALQEMATKHADHIAQVYQANGLAAAVLIDYPDASLRMMENPFPAPYKYTIERIGPQGAIEVIRKSDDLEKMQFAWAMLTIE